MGLAGSERPSRVLHDYGTRHKCAGTVVAISHDDAKVGYRAVSISAECRPYAGDHASDVRLFSNRLMEVWAGGHAEWEQAIERQKEP